MSVPTALSYDYVSYHVEYGVDYLFKKVFTVEVSTLDIYFDSYFRRGVACTLLRDSSQIR